MVPRSVNLPAPTTKIKSEFLIRRVLVVGDFFQGVFGVVERDDQVLVANLGADLIHAVKAVELDGHLGSAAHVHLAAGLSERQIEGQTGSDGVKLGILGQQNQDSFGAGKRRFYRLDIVGFGHK